MSRWAWLEITGIEGRMKEGRKKEEKMRMGMG